MLESLITVSSIGFLVGFIFSMPVAGPISLLITSYSLKGKRKFSIMAAIGAAIIDFLYCFIAVYGFTQLFPYYAPYIRYLLLLGGVIIILVGIRIFRTRIDFLHLDMHKSLVKSARKMDKRGGFITGIFINLFNPTLFFGWLISSFMVLSIAASGGLNVGGLDNVLEQNVRLLNNNGSKTNDHYQINVQTHLSNLNKSKDQITQKMKTKRTSPVWLSGSYASFVAIGTIVWFSVLSGFLVKNRRRLPEKMLHVILKALGVILVCSGSYLMIRSLMLFSG